MYIVLAGRLRRGKSDDRRCRPQHSAPRLFCVDSAFPDQQVAAHISSDPHSTTPWQTPHTHDDGGEDGVSGVGDSFHFPFDRPFVRSGYM